MIPALVNDGPHMLICKGIKNGFSFPAARYQLILLPDPKLMGNSRLIHIQYPGQISDTHLCFKKDKQNPYSGGIPKYLK